MQPYFCTYFLPNDQAQLRFRCMAEDSEHAIEQLLNAEPSADGIYCAAFVEKHNDQA